MFLVEQYTIGFEYLAYFLPKNQKQFLYKKDIMQLFSADPTMFKKNGLENMKKMPSKVAHNRPKCFFSVLPTGPKQAQISFSVP